MKSTERNNRQSLSLRVPYALAEQVEAYARENNLRKTDAYIHFLEVGLRQNDCDVAASLAEMSGKLDTLYFLLNDGEAPAGTPLEQQRVLEILAKVSERFPGIERTWLFGSYARNQQNADSDIDIRLELDQSTGFNLHDLASFSKMIEQETGKECDVITTSTIKSRSLAQAIERDGVCAYERKEE